MGLFWDAVRKEGAREVISCCTTRFLGKGTKKWGGAGGWGWNVGDQGVRVRRRACGLSEGKRGSNLGRERAWWPLWPSISSHRWSLYPGQSVNQSGLGKRVQKAPRKPLPLLEKLPGARGQLAWSGWPWWQTSFLSCLNGPAVVTAY